MSKTSSSGPSIEQQIKADLKKNGRSTVSEIATRIGYSRGYVRKKAKALKDDGQIQGAKNQDRRAPAYIINGDFRILGNNKSVLLDVIKKHKPGHHARLKGASVSTLQSFIEKHIASRVVASEAPWEFWTK